MLAGTGHGGLFTRQVIGLLGGSFDPAHAGHIALSAAALKALRLSGVWWIVSLRNPLKPAHRYAGFDHRLEQARTLTAPWSARFAISAIEARLEARTTAALLDGLTPLLRSGRFVWLMGADSFAQLHRWQRWREVAGRIPLAVFDRPGFTRTALASPAARALAGYRIADARKHALAFYRPPAWGFFPMPLNPMSSTALRSPGEPPEQAAYSPSDNRRISPSVLARMSSPVLN